MMVQTEIEDVMPIRNHVAMTNVVYSRAYDRHRVVISFPSIQGSNDQIRYYGRLYVSFLSILMSPIQIMGMISYRFVRFTMEAALLSALCQ